MNWKVFINTLRFKAEQRRAVLSDDTTATTLEAVADAAEFAMRNSLDCPADAFVAMIDA
jgi:hypothetical protein